MTIKVLISMYVEITVLNNIESAHRKFCKYYFVNNKFTYLR